MIAGTRMRNYLKLFLILSTVFSVSAQASVNRSYSALARAVVETEQGNLPAAQDQLKAAVEYFKKTPSEWHAHKDYPKIQKDLVALSKRPALISSDITAVMGRIVVLEKKRASHLGETSWAVSRTFISPLRAVLLCILAIAALIPLWMLQLAFGWQNAAWRYFQIGLAFMLLPTILTGLGSGVGLLADLNSINLGRGILFGGQSLALWFWSWFFPMLGVIFMTKGAYRLCVQFGLFQEYDKKISVPRPIKLNSNDPRTTSFRWDEDV